MRLGYPPAVIYKRQRSDYLRALLRADAEDCGALNWRGRSLDNLYKFAAGLYDGGDR